MQVDRQIAGAGAVPIYWGRKIWSVAEHVSPQWAWMVADELLVRGGWIASSEGCQKPQQLVDCSILLS